MRCTCLQSGQTQFGLLLCIFIDIPKTENGNFQIQSRNSPLHKVRVKKWQLSIKRMVIRNNFLSQNMFIRSWLEPYGIVKKRVENYNLDCFKERR